MTYPSYVNGCLLEPSGIQHIRGCHGTAGCRCEGYRHLNPQLFPAERYTGTLRKYRGLLRTSAAAVDAALLSGDPAQLHEAASLAFREIVDLRSAYAVVECRPTPSWPRKPDGLHLRSDELDAVAHELIETITTMSFR